MDQTIDTPYNPAAQASLYAKLAKVMGELERLEKSGENKFHGYKYASDADVSDAIRGKLAAHNVAFFAQVVRYEPQVDQGKQIKTVVTYEFTFADGDTGATRSCLWVGEALDNQDKGFNKAATAAEKYFLLKTFLLSAGDKEDDTDAADEKAKSKARTQPVRDKLSGKDETNGSRRAVDSDDMRDRDVATRFIERWRGQSLSDAEVLQALGVAKLSEWSQGRKAADSAVNDWLKGKVEKRDDVLAVAMDRVWEATQRHFNDRKHFDNLLVELTEGSVIPSPVTEADLIRIINDNREAEGKAGRGWWRQTNEVQGLKAILMTKYHLSLEDALAKLGKRLHAFPSQQALETAVANMQSSAEFDTLPAGAF